MTKVKICGLSRIEDIGAVNLALPDYIGFVFAESRRKVDFVQAGRLKDLLDKRILTVGVFVNADIKDIFDHCKSGIIDLIQLHGDEDENYINELKILVPDPIIKAVRVKSRKDILEAEELPADYLLLDTYQKDLYGGSGAIFDWSLIPQIDKPYFLAGGLNEGNLNDALKHKPYCLDISSGVETNGFKDKSKIIEVVKMIRSDD